MRTKQDTKDTAYIQGYTAAANGWERVSPYINHFAEASWYLGYDKFALESVNQTSYNINSRVGVMEALWAHNP